ncbi:MAG: TonB-dependent receptor [Rudaea sp.]|uniref:TonB-dependent receptor n=1 Tax=unclassified Rudaea TaxID=2627037 RepID=UPI0010F880D0|nr:MULTISPECIES: TonB-dependent receptor [unclassified Rudaea]MBN8887281.1 TonB-dependent receptor [Rudaea sp.]MBR0344441.1 TonB-dependent receptor [Rudaea sp.]
MNKQSAAFTGTRPSLPQPARNKIAHAVFCALAVFAFGGVHAAANTEAAADAAAANPDPQAQAQPADANASSSLETVTVTANKRSESLQKVPLSISAIDGKALTNAGAQNFTDLISSVPSLGIFKTGSGRSQIILRGINAGNASEDDPQTQETVGLYIDDSPVSVNGFNPEFGLFDLERVEVLRGPQGTLYGAGSMAGAIRLVTRKPLLDTVEGSVEASVAGIDHGGTSYDLRGVINVPLIKDVAGLRVSMYDDRNGGFIKNTTTGEDNINRTNAVGGRVALRVLPSDGLTVDLSIWGHDATDHGRGLDETGNYTRAYKSPENSHQDYTLSNLTLTQELSWGSIVSATSYFDMNVLNRWNLDKIYESTFPSLGVVNGPMASLADQTHLNDFTQEVRALSHDDGALKWLVGAYYHKRNRGYINAFPDPGWDAATGLPSANFGAPPDYPFWGIQNVHIEETALFGEATYKLGNFSLTGGLRAFDWKERHWQYQSGFFNGGATSNGMQHSKEDGVNPKVNVAYDVDENNQVYAQAAKGFRYGGVNQVIPMNLCGAEIAANGLHPSPEYGSDDLWNYEIGSKSSLLDNHLTVNGSLYLIKWNNVQVRRGLNCGVNYVENAAGLTSKGAEIELAWRPISSLKLTAGGSYTHSTLDADMAPLNARAGDFAPFVPKTSFNTSAEYTFPLGEGMHGFVWGGWNYVGKRTTQFNAANSLYRVMDAYDTLNLRAGVQWATMEASVYVQNLNNSDGVVRQVSATPFYPDGAYRVQPRTIGASFRYWF